MARSDPSLRAQRRRRRNREWKSRKDPAKKSQAQQQSRSQNRGRQGVLEVTPSKTIDNTSSTVKRSFAFGSAIETGHRLGSKTVRGHGDTIFATTRQNH